jgi:putative addiction module component (TIGR02574 family)
MSKAQILEELMKLTPEERKEVRAKLNEMDPLEDAWLDEDDSLSEAQKALLEERLADLERHPEKSIPWEEAKARLNARFGK